MPLISVANLTYTIGTRVLLDGAALSIEAGERVGMVGRNGTGKTTLMRIIMGRVRPDSGSVNLQKGARIGYLTQDPELDLTKTLKQEAESGFIELSNIHAELDQVFHQMGLPENADEVMLERLMKQQSDLEHRIEALGGYAVEHKVDAILHGLGFTDAQFAVPVSGLSGGQKGRLALAKLLLEQPDLLLLDEPTNHLDIAGREWLEEFLVNDFPGAVLMVSHDRYMLDRVVTRIEEVEAGRLIEYPGNYTAFTEIRKLRLLTQHRAYENQQSQWAKEEEYIRRFKAGQRAKEAQGRLSKLERQKDLFAIDRPMEMAAMRLQLPKAPRSGDQVAVVREASKRYENAREEDGTVHAKVLFHDLTVTIGRGERWGIIGPNGAGKTTLVRALLSQLELTEGTAKLGANVIVGYFTQLPTEVDPESRVWEFLQRTIKAENPAAAFSEQQARDLAGVFLFSGQDQEKPMSGLSGGERSRARLAALLASAKNLLVLDEPTNHLDIPSAERLESSLSRTEEGGFEGTLLLISHDRALIDATCDHLIVLDGHGGATVFHGNYSEWHRKEMKRRSAPPPPPPRPAKPVKVHPAPASPRPPATAPSQSRQQPNRNGGRGGRNELDKAKGGVGWMPDDRLEKEIEKAGQRLKAAETALSDEAVYRDAQKCRDAISERDAAAAEVSRLEAEWLRRAEEK